MRSSTVLIVAAILTLSGIVAQQKDIKTADAWSKTAPEKDTKVFEQILEYRKKGDFERAVAVAIALVDGKQPDDFLLQTTAVTYFQRAQVDQAKKEKWVVLAVQYSERALKASPNDLVNVFNVGDSYMAAGMNLGKPQGCPYYKKSLQVFERLKADPALQGEWGTIEGERVPLAPYRGKLDQHIEALRALAVNCAGFDKTQ